MGLALGIKDGSVEEDGAVDGITDGTTDGKADGTADGSNNAVDGNTDPVEGSVDGVGEGFAEPAVGEPHSEVLLGVPPSVGEVEGGRSRKDVEVVLAVGTGGPLDGDDGAVLVVGGLSTGEEGTSLVGI